MSVIFYHYCHLITKHEQKDLETLTVKYNARSSRRFVYNLPYRRSFAIKRRGMPTFD